MKWTLPGLTIAFCLGIITANYTAIPPFFFYGFACFFLIAALISLKRDLVFYIALLCVFLSIGAILLKNSQVLPACHIASFTPYKSEKVFLKGMIDSDPFSGPKKTSFILRAKELYLGQTRRQVCGKVLVTAFEKHNFIYGQELVLEGSLYRPFNFQISDRLNYRNYLSGQGIYSLLAVKKGSLIKDTGKNSGNFLKSFAFWIKHSMAEVISKRLSPVSASVLNAMLLGERKGIPDFINENLLRTGTGHILAVSGLHVGIVAFVLLVFLKALRIFGRVRYVILIISLIIYALLTGARPSVLRATVMAIIILGGYLLKREASAYNSLALAALFILFLNPTQLFGISFQLSFACVISILWISPKIKSLFPAYLFGKGWLNFLAAAISVSTAAWLGSLGLVIYYFKIFSPITIFANIIVSALLPLVVISGLTLVLLGSCIPLLGVIFAANCEFFTAVLIKLNSILAAVPGSYFKLNSPPLIYIIGYYGLLLLVFSSYRQKRTSLTKLKACDIVREK